jgi:hypothetical protein
MGVDDIKRRFLEVATPQLRPGEVVDVSFVAVVGSSRNLVRTAAAGAAVGVAAAVLTGGMFIGTAVQVKSFVILTTERLLIMEVNPGNGRPTGRMDSLPRAALAASPVKRGLLWHKVTIGISGAERGLLLKFPIPYRREAVALTQALPTA